MRIPVLRNNASLTGMKFHNPSRACAENREARSPFGAGPVQDWGERATYFSALLEGVRAGDFVAEQQEMYGEIVVARQERAAGGEQ